MNKHEVMQWIKGHKKEVIVGSLVVICSTIIGMTLKNKNDGRDISCDHYQTNALDAMFEGGSYSEPYDLDISNFDIGEWDNGDYPQIVNKVPIGDLGNFGEMIIKNNDDISSGDFLSAVIMIQSN